MLKTLLTMMLALLGLTNAYNLNTNYFPPSRYFCTKYDEYKTTDYYFQYKSKPVLPILWKKVSDVGDCNVECHPCSKYSDGNLDIIYGFSASCDYLDDYDVVNLNLINYTQHFDQPIEYPQYPNVNKILEYIKSPIRKDGIYEAYPIEKRAKLYINKYTICIKSEYNNKVKIIGQSTNNNQNLNSQINTNTNATTNMTIILNMTNNLTNTNVNTTINTTSNNTFIDDLDNLDDDDYINNSTNVTVKLNNTSSNTSSVSPVILSRMATNATFNQNSSSLVSNFSSNSTNSFVLNNTNSNQTRNQNQNSGAITNNQDQSSTTTSYEHVPNSNSNTNVRRFNISNTFQNIQKPQEATIQTDNTATTATTTSSDISNQNQQSTPLSTNDTFNKVLMITMLCFIIITFGLIVYSICYPCWCCKKKDEVNNDKVIFKPVRNKDLGEEPYHYVAYKAIPVNPKSDDTYMY